MIRLIKFIVFLPPGLLLYMVNPAFRSTVNSKGRRAAGYSKVASGETFLAVLSNNGRDKTIGG